MEPSRGSRSPLSARREKWLIAFVAGGPSTSTLRGQATPRRAIPEHHPAGVGSSIRIDQQGKVADIAVTLEIAHPYIGDLRVDLISPGGQRALLHDRQGGDADDLKVRLTPATTPALSALQGQETRGAWVLRVSDLEGRDVGKLNRWSLDDHGHVTFGPPPWAHRRKS